MRAASMASREAISASSIGAVARDFERANALFLGNTRGFGCLARGDPGDFERLVALDFQLAGGVLGADPFGGERPLPRDPGGFHGLLRLDLRFLDGADLRNLQRAGALVGGDTFDIDDHGLGDPGLLGRLARRDFGFLDRAGALDLAPSGFLLVGDPRIRDRAILLDARLLDRLARRDLGFLDRSGALDVALPHLALGGNTRGIDRALIGDLGLFDFLARQQFLFLDRARALDLAVTGFALGGDAGFGDRLFVGDARLLDGLAGGNLRLFGLGLAQRALARHLGALQRPAHLDVAFLFEAGGLALALDLQRLTLGFEVAGADLDHRILFDVVAQLALGLDVLHQAGQALGVEPVRRIEIFEVGLIEIGDGDRLQLKPVLGQRLGGGGLEPRDVFAALLVHLLHGHFGGHRTYRRDELAGEQGVQLLGFERAPSERRGRDRDRLAGRLHADVKIGLDVDAHAVAGDHRVVLGAHDAHRQHVHVDGRVVVNERQHEGAAVDHHAFAEQTGSHKGHFLRRTVVEPVHDVDDDGDHDDRNDQPEDQFANQSPRHLFLPLLPALPRADRLEFTNLFRQRPLHRQALHRGGAVEAVALARVFHDEVGIRRARRSGRHGPAPVCPD